MQLYALDEEKKGVLASHAIKGVDYYCPECRSVLHLRGGLYRQDHYYHVEHNRNCRQSGKGQEHIQTQLYFLNSLPTGECELERPFPEIGRIADVYWEKERFVFEVQCAPISSEEVLARTRDYSSCGLTVVWVFHDARYNKWRPTPAEMALAGKLFYYTDIDANGSGEIYDLFALHKVNGDKCKLERLPIDIARPGECLEYDMPKTSSTFIKKRIAHKRYFVGDILDQFIKGDVDGYCARVEELEVAYADASQPSWRACIAGHIAVPFRVVGQIILERFCR